MGPPQESVAVMLGAEGMASQFTVVSLGIVSLNDGGVVSTMVRLAETEAVLPVESAAVKVYVVVPAVQAPGVFAPALLDQFMSSALVQLSVAVAPPWLASQEAMSAVFPAPSHSMVVSLAAVRIGSSVSLTFTVKLIVEEFPDSSMAV